MPVEQDHVAEATVLALFSNQHSDLTNKGSESGSPWAVAHCHYIAGESDSNGTLIAKAAALE